MGQHSTNDSYIIVGVASYMNVGAMGGVEVKIQSETQVLGRPVRDGQGRRLGRVVAVDCAPDPYTAAWFLLHLSGWRRQLRAVPACSASWDKHGALAVPYPRQVVEQSPQRSRDGQGAAFVAGELEAFYAAVAA